MELIRMNFNPLILLQNTGNKTPLFLIHPGNGTSNIFRKLSTYFINERPVYGVQAKGISTENEEAFFYSLDEMTEIYGDAIISSNSDDFFLIGGYSYGCLIAFNVAKYLEQKTEKKVFLFSIDMALFTLEKIYKLNDIDFITRIAGFLGMVDESDSEEIIKQYQQVNSLNASSFVYNYYLSNKPDWHKISFNKFNEWVWRSKLLLNLLADFRIDGNIHSVTAFYTKHNNDTTPVTWYQKQLYWQDVSRIPLILKCIEGHHYRVLSEPYIGQLAPLFQQTLNYVINKKCD